MNTPVCELADLLEEEISVGEELERNLAAQKQALVGWDVEELLRQITIRENWLRALTALEGKRTEVSQRIQVSTQAATLRELIGALPQDEPNTARLRLVRARAGQLFARLARNERSLQDLLGNLLGHVQQALRPLTEPAAPLYSEAGTTEPARTGSALIHSKA